MDPSSFTKTSFCNVEIDNITTNESKKYICLCNAKNEIVFMRKYLMNNSLKI